VPLSEEFFSGGGSTLRGFPLNGAGPQREIAACGDPADPSTCASIRVPVGGNQLFIVNSELRIPVPIKKNLGIAVFYDGGNVYQHVGFHNFLSDFSNTVGGGLRYATPVGPVRIDIGHNLNSLAGIKATQIFVTLGQAF
jgi:outer membrane protein insertion porin family